MKIYLLLIITLGVKKTKSAKSNINIKTSFDSEAILEKIKRKREEMKTTEMTKSTSNIERSKNSSKSRDMSLVWNSLLTFIHFYLLNRTGNNLLSYAYQYKVKRRPKKKSKSRINKKKKKSKKRV